MHRFSDLPTIFHITHWKAGSQWVYQVLDTIAPDRIVIPQAEVAQFLTQPIIQGMIYPTLYVTHEEFEAQNIPDPSLTFFIMRDLRDTLVSWYFSYKRSHVDMQLDAFAQIRKQLNERTLEDGLRLGIHSFLREVARIHTSWCRSDTPIFRYEDILHDPFGQFKSILHHCQIEVADSTLQGIVNNFSFEARSGRRQGIEDVNSHYRKGIQGDWKNYLTGDLLIEFKDVFDDVLMETGYEHNRDWGLSEILRTYAVPDPIQKLKSRVSDAETVRCWCSSDSLTPFSPEYFRCSACGSLVCKYPVTLDDLLITDDEADLYGRNYWHLPRFYVQRGEKFDLYKRAFNIYEHAQYHLYSDASLDRLRELLKYKNSGGEVLEIGCGSGAFSSLMQQAGFNVTCLEMSPWVVDFVKQTFNLKVYQGPVEKQSFAPGSFDAIVLSEVIQHFPDPVTTLKHCASLLKPDGLILIETPFFDSRTYDQLRDSGSPLLEQLRPIVHMVLFTEAAIKQLLERVGLPSVVKEDARMVVCGATPLVERPEAEREITLTESFSGRLVLALLNSQHRVTRSYARRENDRSKSFAQLKRALTSTAQSLQGDLIGTGQGWYPLENYQGEVFQWVSNNAELVIHAPTGQNTTLSITLEPGPGLGSQPFTLAVLDTQGKPVATAPVNGRQTVQVKLPLEKGHKAVFRLYVEGGGLPTPGDPRILNFRVFHLDWA